MVQIEAPVSGAEIDTSEPLESVGSIGKAIIGGFVTIMVFGTANYLWEMVSEETPGDQKIEVL